MPDKPRGRPGLTPDGTTTTVNVRVPTSDYDRACSRAKREGTSLSQVIRDGIRRVVDEDEAD